eukprot:TCONS_00012762-protein
MMFSFFKMTSIEYQRVYKWSEINNMQLNGLKFEHMRYGKNEELKPNSVYYSDTHDQIETKNKVKDLGVTLDVDSYSQHIQNQISKVKGISSFRTFKTRNPLEVTCYSTP